MWPVFRRLDKSMLHGIGVDVNNCLSQVFVRSNSFPLKPAHEKSTSSEVAFIIRLRISIEKVGELPTN